MEVLSFVADFIIHIDKYLDIIIQQFGVFSYLLLFLIIFLETGLVVTPFLPGDSLLFAAGAFAARGSFQIFLLYVVVAAAAILGNSVNYLIGKFIGDRILASPKKLIKPEYLEKTHRFFEKYGGATVILTRFVPIIRTISPFVAGLGAMTWGKFTLYNIAGGILWTALCT